MEKGSFGGITGLFSDKHATKEMRNSARVPSFTSKEFTERLLSKEIRISMDGRDVSLIIYLLSVSGGV